MLANSKENQGNLSVRKLGTLDVKWAQVPMDLLYSFQIPYTFVRYSWFMEELLDRFLPHKEKEDGSFAVGKFSFYRVFKTLKKPEILRLNLKMKGKWTHPTLAMKEFIRKLSGVVITFLAVQNALCRVSCKPKGQTAIIKYFSLKLLKWHIIFSTVSGFNTFESISTILR